MRWLVCVLCWAVMAFGACARAQTVDERGWTELSPGQDTRRVYVSSSDGSDTNSGLFPDRAKRTLAGGRALVRDGMADQLLLRRGDVWEEALRGWSKSGSGPGEAMVISSYGRSDERPVVRSVDGHAFSRDESAGGDVSHLAIIGIRFQTRSGEGGASGFWWLGAGSDLLIEDCVFEGGANGIVLQKRGGRLRDVRVRRSVVVDIGARFGHSQGLYAWGVDGLLIEGCVFDGGSAPADPLRRQIHVGSDNSGVMIRGNLIARSPGDGVLLASGGVIEGNVFVRCPRAVTLGGGAYDPLTHTRGITGEVRRNVVLDCDEGIVVSNIGQRGAVIEGNTLVRTGGVALSLGAAVGIAQPAPPGVGVQSVLVRRNVVYSFGVGVRITPPRPGGVALGHRVEANQLVGAGVEDSALIELGSGARGQVVFSANVYSAAPGGLMLIDGERVGLRAWSRWSGEADALGAVPTYVEPGRSLATYNASLGGGGTVEALLSAARSQSRLRWDEGYTGAAVGAYIREGFRIAPEGSAYAP